MNHKIIEKNIGLMVFLVLLVVSLGGLAQIVPLLFIKTTTTPVEGLKPWDALAVEGRDIYIREGCTVCHTQMIRALPGDTARYGERSQAGEFVYEHPFVWGSKRTGPDLARVGGLYSDDWHLAHLYNPRDVVPESNMPSFPWLFDAVLDGRGTAKKLRGLRAVGVPYTDEDIELAQSMVEGKTEAQALVYYLQLLGKNFTSTAKDNKQEAQ